MKNAYTAGILTVSDGVSRGEKEDTAGPAISRVLSENGFNVLVRKTVPDERVKIEDMITHWCDVTGLDLVITTGGTGPSPRDVTPEATLAVLHRLIPGIPEAMRLRGLESTPRAMLSRAVAGTRGESLIINLPGSLSAVNQAMEVISPVLRHLLDKLKGDPTPCGLGGGG